MHVEGVDFGQEERRRFGAASPFFVSLDGEEEEGRRESQRKARPLGSCYIFVCTSFFRETWLAAGETCRWEIAEFRDFRRDFTRLTSACGRGSE
jgi:hypothetical protein